MYTESEFSKTSTLDLSFLFIFLLKWINSNKFELIHLPKNIKSILTLTFRKRGPRTRGGLSRTSLAQKKTSSKEAERIALEDTWKRKDSRPHIPEFTSKSSINAELPDDPTPLDFLDLFLDEEFYKYLTTQTNLYTAQYLQANPDLLPHSPFQKWKDVSC